VKPSLPVLYQDNRRLIGKNTNVITASVRREPPAECVEEKALTYDDKLIAALEIERPDVAAISAEVLGARRVSRAGPALIAALDRWWDADEVAVAIIHALAVIDGDEVIAPLVAVLTGRSLRQRIAAAEALGRFAHPVARTALQRAAREDPNAAVRTAATRAVGGDSA